MNKLIVTVIQLLIDLKLLKNYKLCKTSTLNDLAATHLRMLDDMAATHLKTEAKMLEDAYILEGKISELEKNLQDETYKVSTTNEKWEHAKKQRDDAEQRCEEYNRQQRDLNKSISELNQTINDKEAEAKLAASEMIVLLEGISEATALSKQLKEALDRWTS